MSKSKISWKELSKNISEIESKSKLEKYIKDNIEIKEYLPLVVKEQVTNFIIMDMEFAKYNSIDAVQYEIQMEYFNVFEMVKAYTNIEINQSEMNYGNYDLLMSSGVYEQIKKICYNDFCVIKECSKNAVTAETLKNFGNAITNIDVTKLNEGIIAFKHVIENPEATPILKSMVNLIYMNDPMTKKIKDAILETNDE